MSRIKFHLFILYILSFLVLGGCQTKNVSDGGDEERKGQVNDDAEEKKPNEEGGRSTVDDSGSDGDSNNEPSSFAQGLISGEQWSFINGFSKSTTSTLLSHVKKIAVGSDAFHPLVG